MMAHPGIILAVAATVIYNLGFICEKRALDRLPAIEAHRLGHLVRTLFTAPAWLAGFLLICCGLMLQVLVLSLEPLTVAQPLQASGVVVTILFSRLILHERLGRAELTCIGIIAVAVGLLSLSNGHGPGTEAGTHAAGAAIAAAALPAFLVVPAIYYLTHRASGRRHRHRHRHRHRITGVSYGCCAGLVYGFAGVALKALSASIFTTPHARDGLLAAAIASPYLYAVLVSSAIGMCLFQVALQRSPASIVMPISLVISTGYLVIIGSWLFHEQLPASPALLAMRLGGAVAAIAAPVILTVVSERGATRPGFDNFATSAADASAAHDPRREDRRFLPGQKAGAARREPDEPGYPAAEPARLPDRQAGTAVPGRVRRPVQPATAPQLPDQ
jgi:drug/metabolite transporter (DMT)-like permease